MTRGRDRGADIIQFAPALTAGGATTITLTGGELPISGEVTIIGPGRDLLAVSGNRATRVMNISAATTVTVSGLTLTEGSATVSGGLSRTM